MSRERFELAEKAFLAFLGFSLFSVASLALFGLWDLHECWRGHIGILWCGITMYLSTIFAIFAGFLMFAAIYFGIKWLTYKEKNGQTG